MRRPAPSCPAILGLTLSLACVAGGCGGGPSFRGGVYEDAEARYRVGELGPGWDAIDVSQNDLAWHNSELGAVVHVNATCDPYQDVPLTSLTNHLMIGFTDREWVRQERVTVDSRAALRSRVTAQLDGVPRELLVYVLNKDNCTYDFALVAAPGAYDQAEAALERLVAGFSTEAR